MGCQLPVVCFLHSCYEVEWSGVEWSGVERKGEGKGKEMLVV